MANQKPNPNPTSAKETPDAKRRADQATGKPAKPELDGKNDSGVEPEIHGHELPGE
jgi:hypothetical protein